MIDPGIRKWADEVEVMILGEPTKCVYMSCQKCNIFWIRWEGKPDGPAPCILCKELVVIEPTADTPTIIQT